MRFSYHCSYLTSTPLCAPPTPPLLICSPETNTPFGLAIYLYTYSTWMASPSVYLEELYVLPEYRRMGYAKLLIQAMAREAHKAGCSKMEWVCLEAMRRL